MAGPWWLRFNHKYLNAEGVKSIPLIAALLLVPIGYNYVAYWPGLKLEFQTRLRGSQIFWLVALPLWIVVSVPAILTGFGRGDCSESFRYYLSFPSRWLLIGFWLLQLTGWVIFRHVPGLQDDFDRNSWPGGLGSQSVTFAFLAMVNMQYFLLPISRTSPLLALFKVDPAVSVEYHRLLGWWMLVFLLLHAVFMIAHWMYNDSGGNLWDATPRKYPAGFARVFAEITSTSTPVPSLAGLIGIITIVTMGITALPRIRRARYEVFVYTHRVGALVFVTCASVHWDGMLVWAFGNIVLYLADYASQMRAYLYPLPVLKARSKAGILSITFPCQNEPKPMSWVSVNNAGASSLQWHTFTVARSTPTSFTIVPKIIPGGWTEACCQALLSKEITSMRVSNFYNDEFTPSDWDASCKPLIFVAGGSGGVCFTKILQHIAQQESQPMAIQLIWICRFRDELKEYIHMADLAHMRKRIPGLEVHSFVVGPEHEEVELEEVVQENPKVLFPPDNQALLVALCHIFVPLLCYIGWRWALGYGTSFLPSDAEGNPLFNKWAGLLKLFMVLIGAVIGGEIAILVAGVTGKARKARDLEMSSELNPVVSTVSAEKADSKEGELEYTAGRPDLKIVMGTFSDKIGAAHAPRVFCSGPPPLLAGAKAAAYSCSLSFEEFSFAL